MKFFFRKIRMIFDIENSLESPKLALFDKLSSNGDSKSSTVKLGNKERFDKEQIGIKELFMDYQPFYTINLLLDKELLPI